MSGRRVLEYLEQVCRDLDAGRAPRRGVLRRLLLPLAVPAAIGLAAGLGAGCGARHTPPGEGDEVCDNGVDDDEDQDCFDDPSCVMLYGNAFE